MDVTLFGLARHMVYLSHIKSCYTCETNEKLAPHEFIDPAPHARAAQTLNKSLSYWETFWIVGPLEGKYMADQPVLNTIRDEPRRHQACGMLNPA